MEKISVLKNNALRSLSDKWGLSALVTLTTVVILNVFYIYSLFCDNIFQKLQLTYLHIIWNLFMIPLSWGFCTFFLGLARDENMKISQLFDGFKNRYGHVLFTMFLVGFYLILWCIIPCIIPLIPIKLIGLILGIIKYYSYAMTPYILKDEPELSANKAIEKSMAMMKGYKKKLFLLDLSMIGWLLLSILTLGIGCLFLLPYWITTRAKFYEALKEDEKNLEATIR